MCSYYFFLCVESELGVVRVLLASRYARRNFSLVGEKMMSSRVTAWMGLKTGGDDDSIETPFFFFLVSFRQHFDSQILISISFFYFFHLVLFT